VTVEVSADGGLYELITGQRAGLIDPSRRWQKSVVSLSNWAGSNIQLRFGFNTVDDYANDYTGFAVDNLVIHDGSDLVYFEDPNLQAEVEAELGIIDPTAADMLNLKFLNIYDAKGINSLVGLEYALNLQDSLYLWSNKISDLSPLAGLIKLQMLFLDDNQISNLSPLAGLTKLQRISLSSNQISDLSPLADLSSLQRFILFGNQISDLSPLEGLTNLQRIELSSNQISNLLPLSGLNNLLSLYLGSNQINDPNLAHLVGLTNLQELYLYNNHISDISPLDDMTKLQYLLLFNNQIADILPLAGMNKLQYLDLRSNQVSDLSPLADLINLQSLWLWNNQISDISWLSVLTNLQYLRLKRNPLNTAAYCQWIPIIEAKNPGIDLTYDSNPNPLTDDCSTILIELFAFLSRWLDTECRAGNNWCGGADLDHADDVNLSDWAVFAGLWLKGL